MSHACRLNYVQFRRRLGLPMPEKRARKAAGNVSRGAAEDFWKWGAFKASQVVSAVLRWKQRSGRWSYAAALFAGELTILGRTYDYGMKDFDDIIALNEEESGTPTNMVIMSISAWQAFKNNKKVMAMMGNPAHSKWISFGNMNSPGYNPAMQASLKGGLDLTEGTLEVWVYGGRYFDEADSQTKRYVPEGCIWVGSNDTRCDTLPV